MKALVVYFSRSGNTRGVAERIATGVGADLEPIVDRARRAGWIGWLRCAYEGSSGRPAEIEPSAHDPAGYDVVIVGGPIWASSLSSPVRAWLARHQARLPALAFFCTCGGRGIDQMFAQMTDEAGKAPIATLALRERELGGAPAAVTAFVAEIEAALSHPAGRPSSSRAS